MSLLFLFQNIFYSNFLKGCVADYLKIVTMNTIQLCKGHL